MWNHLRKSLKQLSCPPPGVSVCGVCERPERPLPRLPDRQQPDPDRPQDHRHGGDGGDASLTRPDRNKDTNMSNWSEEIKQGLWTSSPDKHGWPAAKLSFHLVWSKWILRRLIWVNSSSCWLFLCFFIILPSEGKEQESHQPQVFGNRKKGPNCIPGLCSNWVCLLILREF